jgi:methionyl-tRNA formyltransferase
MRVVLLTTDTIHHTYFAWKVAQSADLCGIVIETRTPTPPFDTHHAFETTRDEYERNALLAGFDGSFGELAQTRAVESVNDAIDSLRALEPDVLIDFGTSRILAGVIEVATVACLNLHGGNPEEYRGLDTHLWAIYHRDFGELVTTLHHVDEGLDTGDIVHLDPLPLKRAMGLHQLRAVNTQVCVDLTLRALGELETGSAPRRPQTRRGRYYSFMPAVLKERCVVEFDRYVTNL